MKRRSFIGSIVGLALAPFGLKAKPVQSDRARFLQMAKKAHEDTAAWRRHRDEAFRITITRTWPKDRPYGPFR